MDTTYQVTRPQLVDLVEEAIREERVVGPDLRAPYQLTGSAADRVRLVAATHGRVAFGRARVGDCGCLTIRAIDSLSYDDWDEAVSLGISFGYLALRFDSRARDLTGENIGVLEVVD